MRHDELPFVSIGIAFYNAERYLASAIQSVTLQTHQNWELILIDDGSTDGSLEVARRFESERVRVYSDGCNRKLAYRLNQIVGLARYQYVARMDADDLMARNRIQRQLEFLAENADVDIVTTGVCTISDDGRPLGKRVARSSGARSVSLLDAVRGRSGIVHASIIGKRSWFERNPYDPKDHIAQDYSLWVRAASRGDLRVGYIAQPLYFYREEGSVTARKILLGYAVGKATVQRLGYQSLGPVGCTRAWTELIAKELAVRVSDVFGLTRFLVRRRGIIRLSPGEFVEIGREIQSVCSP